MKHKAIVEFDIDSVDKVFAKLRDIFTNQKQSPARGERWAWRGQRDASWELVPKAFRPGEILGFDHETLAREITGDDLAGVDQHTAEFFAVSEFLQLADKLGLHVPGDTQVFRSTDAWTETVGKSAGRTGRGGWPPHQILEVMALAQHHGVPTRLLDFSQRPWVAAFFAAHDAVDGQTSHFSIWGVDTAFLSTAAHHMGYEQIVRVTVPRAFNRNLHAQHGVFLVDKLVGADTGDGREPAQLNRAICEIADLAWNEGWIDRAWPPMFKINVPVPLASQMLDLLALDGYDAAHLMPSFESVVSELRRRQKALAARRKIYKVGPASG